MDRIPVGARFSAPVQTVPGDYPVHSGYRVFPGGKAVGTWRWPPTPYSAEVKERVELYLYSHYGSSWPALERNLPYFYLYIYIYIYIYVCVYKGRLCVLQHCCIEAYCTLTRMSSFIHLQRHCTHQAAWETSASERRNYTWNLASNP